MKRMWFLTSKTVASMTAEGYLRRWRTRAAISAPASAWPLKRMRSVTVKVGGLPVS